MEGNEELDVGPPERIEQFVLENESAEKASWSSVLAAAFLLFKGSFQYHMFWSVLFFFWIKMDPMVSLEFIGFVGSAHNCIQLLMAVLFGRSSRIITTYRKWICALSSLTSIGGCIMFLLVPYSSIPPSAAITATILLMAIPAGSFAILRNFLVETMVKSDKGHSQAMVYAPYIAATLAAPLVLSVLSYFELEFDIFGFRVDVYSAPMILVFMVNVISFFLELTFIKSTRCEMKKAANARFGPPDEQNLNGIAALAFGTNGIALFLMALIESVVPIYFVCIYSWSHERAIFVGALMNICYGVTSGILNSDTFKGWINRFDQKKLILAGLWLIGAFYLTILVSSCHPCAPIMETTSNATSEIVICKHAWCNDAQAAHPAILIVAYIGILTIVHSVICFALIPFCITGRGTSGTSWNNGLFMVVTNLRTVITPFFAMVILGGYGPTAIWIIGLAGCSVAVSMWLLMF